ncbi:MAG: mannosyl-3-phosphoglycerate phosphatase, partial [Verrucomicrobiota bacterium]|nr:mannosyl-3-phosphoglycerate phosphatase [Verrucomicrobiota bacterium]
ALGDSANDTAMLEAADIAVVIPHADGAHISPKAPRVIHASFPASKGWNAAILLLLDECCEHCST